MSFVDLEEQEKHLFGKRDNLFREMASSADGDGSYKELLVNQPFGLEGYYHYVSPTQSSLK